MKRILFLIIFFFTCFLFTGCESARTSSIRGNPLVRYFARPGSIFSYRYMRLLYQDDFHKLDKSTQQALSLGIMRIPEEDASIPASSASVKTKRLIDYPSFMDDSGFITTFKSIPFNVAVLDSSYAQIWKLAGGSIRITVQETVDRDLVTESDVTLVDQMTDGTIDYELLLSDNPDLVIVNADNNKQQKLADLLRVYDIPVLALKIDSFLDYLSALSIFTEILNTPKHYEEYGSKLLDQIEAIIDDATVSARVNKVHVIIRQETNSNGDTLTPPFVLNMLEELGAIWDTTSDPDTSDIVVDTLVDRDLDSDDDQDTVDSRELLDNETMNDQEKTIILDLTTKENAAMFSALPNKNWPQAYEYLAQLLYGPAKE